MSTLPYLLPGTPDGPGIVERLTTDGAEIRKLLTTHGAVMLRGFEVGGVAGIDEAVRALAGEPLVYTERSSPRHSIKGRVYTSTDYPPDEEIFLHNENSYQARWPLTLFFYCVTPPDTQGATPLADVRRVYELIDPAVREEFVRRRWMLVRNFHGDFGTRWQDVFNTESRAEVEAYAAANGMTAEWVGRGRAAHPRGPRRGAPPAGLGHPALVQPRHLLPRQHSCLPSTRRGCWPCSAADGLPSNTYYGDGGEIPADVMDHLRAAYRAGQRSASTTSATTCWWWTT